MLHVSNLNWRICICIFIFTDQKCIIVNFKCRKFLNYNFKQILWFCNMASSLCPSAVHPSISLHFLFPHICLTPIYINCHLVLLLLMVRVISFLLSLWSLLTIPLISPLLLHHCPPPPHTHPPSLSRSPPLLPVISPSSLTHPQTTEHHGQLIIL